MDDLLKRHSHFIGFDTPLRRPLFVCERNLYCPQWVAKTVAPTYRPDVINVYTFNGLGLALNNQGNMSVIGD